MATRSQILALARTQLGTTEQPPGSNRVKYNDFDGINWQGAAWCMAFQSWLFWMLKALAAIGGMVENYTVAEFKRMLKLGRVVTSPQVGDLVFYNWGKPDGYREDGDRGIHHVEIIEFIRADGMLGTIGGNTSVSSDDNGGAVMRRVRSRSGVAAYARPAYDPEPKPAKYRVGLVLPSATAHGWTVAASKLAATDIISRSFDHDGKPWVAWVGIFPDYDKAHAFVDQAETAHIWRKAHAITKSSIGISAYRDQIKAEFTA